VMSMGGMGYAAEYHVERYMRECFVPRIAPVSRVCTFRVPSGTSNGFADYRNRR
jgi:alkylation response protein AidB-like acyl-CoA dehydrogenase